MRTTGNHGARTQRLPCHRPLEWLHNSCFSTVPSSVVYCGGHENGVKETFRVRAFECFQNPGEWSEAVSVAAPNLVLVSG